jgi:Protein of unknown function (DUF2934)
MTQDTIRKTLTKSGSPPSLEEQIRQRAYELYEERDSEDGHELEDWLRAEEEITQQKPRTKAA